MLGVKNKTDAEFNALQNKMISSVSAKDTFKKILHWYVFMSKRRLFSSIKIKLF